MGEPRVTVTHSNLTAECRVCGERISVLLAPLHIDDHQQRGEFPEGGGSNG